MKLRKIRADEIEALPAGREMDRRVAEALGWVDIHEQAYTPTGPGMCGTLPDGMVSPWGNGRGYVPCFSAQFHDTPLKPSNLLTWLKDQGLRVVLAQSWDGQWSCRVYRQAEPVAETDFCEGLALALCRAVLKVARLPEGRSASPEGA